METNEIKMGRNGKKRGKNEIENAKKWKNGEKLYENEKKWKKTEEMR